MNYFLDEMGKAIDHYSNRYENFVTLGDFNIEEKQAEIKTFMEIYQPKSLIKNLLVLSLIILNELTLF